MSNTGWTSSPPRTIGSEGSFASSRSAFFPGGTGATGAKGSQEGAQDTNQPVQPFQVGECNPAYARRPSATSTTGFAISAQPFQANLLPSASFGGSPQSVYGGNSSGGLSKLRRQSILADTEGSGPFDDDEQDDKFKGDDHANSMADEMDVEMETGGGLPSTINSNTFSNNVSPSRPINALPYRQRSLSQSTGNNPFVRSSPPWPNSPPRAFGAGGGQQHLLARLASEQQQAAIATAAANISPLTVGSISGPKSASSGHFNLVPASMRQYTQNMGSGLTASDEADHIYMAGKDSADMMDDEYRDYEADQEEEGASSKDFAPRSFNPLNPLSLKPSSSNTSSSARPASSSRSSETGNMTMDDVISSDANGGSGPNGSTTKSRPSGLSPKRSMSSETMGMMPSLRHSRSSPSLAGGKEMNETATVNDSDSRQQYQEPPGQGRFATMPSTPPPRQPHLSSQFPPGNSQTASLRRSVSASHRISTVGHSHMNGDDVPQTAPLTGGTFPPSSASPFRRANSFSGRSAISPHSPGPPIQNDNLSHASRRDLSGKPDNRKLHHHGRADASKAAVPRAMSQSSGSDTNTGNAAGGDVGSLIVRRPVNHRKGSLMPKSKDHLRIMSQLRLETGEFEVASEAALNRISQSTPSYPGFTSPRQGEGRRSGASGNSQFGVGPGPHGPASHSPFSTLSPARTTGERGGVLGSGGPGGKPAVPTRNRFPEAAVLDDDDDNLDSSGSEPDYGTAGEGNGGQMSDNLNDDDDQMSVTGAFGADGTIDGARMSNAWTLRDPSMTSQWAAQNRLNLTPGGTNRSALEVENSPSSAFSWANAVSRPGKRKMNDSERFEPYSSAFKRRAVSPASTSSVSLSPLLTNANSAALPNISHLATLGPPAHNQNQTQAGSNGPTFAHLAAAPVGSGLSENNSSNNSAANRSRAASPALSVASSVGGASTRKWAAGNGQQGSEEDKKVDFGQMSLG